MATVSRSTRSTQRDWLAEIATEAKKKPTAAVIYGPPGIGKTEFGASFPKPLFLIDDQEDGINTLKSSGSVSMDIPVFPAASNWLDVRDMLASLIAGNRGEKTLVVDTIGGMERLCHTHVCAELFKGEWGDKGFASYNKGYETSLPYWRELLNDLDRLRNEKGMGVILIAHSIIKPFANPVGEDYDQYIPDVHKKTWAVTHKWADLVLFCSYDVATMKEKGDSKAKGRGGQTRTIHTEYNAAFEAKNRFRLPPEIDMGGCGKEAFANLKQAMSQAKGGA